MAESTIHFENTSASNAASVFELKNNNEVHETDIAASSSATVETGAGSEWIIRATATGVKLGSLIAMEGEFTYDILWPRGLPETSGTSGSGGGS